MQQSYPDLPPFVIAQRAVYYMNTLGPHQLCDYPDCDVFVDVYTSNDIYTFHKVGEDRFSISSERRGEIANDASEAEVDEFIFTIRHDILIVVSYNKVSRRDVLYDYRNPPKFSRYSP